MSTVLTATAATESQTSAQQRRPIDKPRSVIVTIDVTAGTTLSLLVRLRAVDAGGTELFWTVAPAAALTGVSKAHYLFTEDAASGVGSGIAESFFVPIPESLSVRVAHGNANAATYTVDLDWQ